MANTQTLKQKFLDILFEEDDEDIEEAKEKIARDVPRVKASDLLYGKKENKPLIIKEEPKVSKEVKKEVNSFKENNNDTFINYNKELNKNKVNEVRNNSVDEIYISQPALSPIFGNVEKDKKNRKEETVSVDTAFVDKPNSNHLGIVLSPIYGYDTAKLPEDKKITKKEEVIKDKDITTDLGDIFATDEFKQEAFIENEDEQEKTAEIDLFSDFYTTKE